MNPIYRFVFSMTTPLLPYPNNNNKTTNKQKPNKNNNKQNKQTNKQTNKPTNKKLSKTRYCSKNKNNDNF